MSEPSVLLEVVGEPPKPLPRYRRRPTMPGPEAYAGPPVTITVLPQVVNLVLYEGDDFTFTLTVTEPDGSPSDLSGVTIRSEIRRTPSDPLPISGFTPTIAENVITLWLASARAQIAGNSVWDAQMTDSGGRVTTLAAGTINSTPQVTRSNTP